MEKKEKTDVDSQVFQYKSSPKFKASVTYEVCNGSHMRDFRSRMWRSFSFCPLGVSPPNIISMLPALVTLWPLLAACKHCGAQHIPNGQLKMKLIWELTSTHFERVKIRLLPKWTNLKDKGLRRSYRNLPLGCDSSPTFHLQVERPNYMQEESF